MVVLVCGKRTEECEGEERGLTWIDTVWCNSGYSLIEAVFGAMRENGALCGAGWGARVRGLSLSVSGLGAAGVVDCFFCVCAGGSRGLRLRWRRVGSLD